MYRVRAALYGKKPIKSCYECARPKNTTNDTSYRELYATCRRASIQRDLEFNITLEQHSNLSINNCHHCGEPPTPYNRYLKANGTRRASMHTIKQAAVNAAWITINGIDRLDSSVGYTIENCVACCYDCNVAKAEKTEEAYIEHCRKVVYFQDSK